MEEIKPKNIIFKDFIRDEVKPCQSTLQDNNGLTKQRFEVVKILQYFFVKKIFHCNSIL